MYDRGSVVMLVGSFMRQKDSIFLAVSVVAANMNLVSHIALEKTKAMDPQRP